MHTYFHTQGNLFVYNLQSPWYILFNPLLSTYKEVIVKFDEKKDL